MTCASLAALVNSFLQCFYRVLKICKNLVKPGTIVKRSARVMIC